MTSLSTYLSEVEARAKVVGHPDVPHLIRLLRAAVGVIVWNEARFEALASGGDGFAEGKKTMAALGDWAAALREKGLEP